MKGTPLLNFMPLFKTAGIYGGLNIIRQIIPFLLLPILTHYLTPAEYGTLAMFMVFISLVYIMTGLNFDAAIGREYFEQDTLDFPTYIWNCIVLSSVVAAFLAIVLSILGSFISQIGGVPLELCWVILLIAYTRILAQYLLIIWQSGMRAFRYGAFQISQMAVEVILTIFFLIFLKLGIDGRIGAILLSSIIFFVISAVFLYQERWIKFAINMEYIKSALRFGVPLIPHAIGAIAITMTDRALLMNMLGAEATGLYFIGFQIANVISLAALAFNQAWSPWLFARLKLDDAETKIRIVKFTYLYCVLLASAGGGLVLISPLIFEHLIAPEYFEGIKVVPWIVTGAVFTGMYYMVGSYITYTKKTHILSWITLLTGIINVVLTYLLIKTHGIVGAAQATAISYIIAFILTWGLAARSYPMPWFRGKAS